nr:MAG TPA: hypothetical protein [Caudoviricetes sp.]
MIDFTLEDLLQWNELSPSLQKKFDKMTKEEIENFFKDGGFLDELMKKYLFLNLPPKIGYGRNTTIDIDLGEASGEHEKLNGVLITTRPGMFFLRHNKNLFMFNYGIRYDISDNLSSIVPNVSSDDETRFNFNIVSAQEDIIFVAYGDIIQMIKLNGSWKRADWTITDISSIVSGTYKQYVDFQYNLEWNILNAYCFYWEDTTKSYIVVTALQPSCSSAYYGDDTYMKIDVFDKNLNLIKTERIASLGPKNNKNQFIPSLGDVLLSFDSIFFTYDSKRKLLFIGGSAIYWADYKEGKQRREYNNITPLLTYKDFDIVKYCADVNYKLSSTLVTNVDYISESNFNFIDLTAIASTEIKKDFTNNFKRVNLTYDSVADKYYLSQVAKYNIDGYLHVIDKIDMNNIKGGWSIFNMGSITPKYFLRTYHPYTASKIIKFVDRNNIPNNVYDAKESIQLISDRFYYNEIGNYVVFYFLRDIPKNSLADTHETILIKNPIFNADRTINYKKSSIGSFNFHATTIYDEYGVQTPFLFRRGGNPSFHSSTESKELYKGKFISRILFSGGDKENNKFVIRYSLIPNENDVKYPLITPYDKFYHYDNYYDGGNKMFILEDAIPELKNKKNMSPLYGIPLYNGIAYIAVRYDDNTYIYSINVNTLSYTKAKLESLKIHAQADLKLIDSKLYTFGIDGYAYDGKDNSLYELNKSGDKYTATKCRKFLENITKITGFKVLEIKDIAKNSRYGYMITVICYKGYGTIDRMIVISTKDTIGNGTEYTWDQMIKEGKFYYEIYTKDIIETRFNTMDVLYKRKIKNVTPKPSTPPPSTNLPKEYKYEDKDVKMFGMPMPTTYINYFPINHIFSDSKNNTYIYGLFGTQLLSKDYKSVKQIKNVLDNYYMIVSIQYDTILYTKQNSDLRLYSIKFDPNTLTTVGEEKYVDLKLNNTGLLLNNISYLNSYGINNIYAVLYWNRSTGHYILYYVQNVNRNHHTIAVFDKSGNMVKKEIVLDVSSGTPYNALMNIFMAYNTNKKILSLGYGYNDGARIKNYSIEMDRFCTDANYTLRDHLITKANKEDYGFRSLISYAIEKIPPYKVHTKNMRANLIYDPMIDAYHLIQIGAANIELYMETIKNVDVSNADTGWTMFDFDNSKIVYLRNIPNNTDTYNYAVVDKDNIDLKKLYTREFSFKKEPMSKIKYIGNGFICGAVRRVEYKNYVKEIIDVDRTSVGDIVMLFKNPVFNNRVIDYSKTVIATNIIQSVYYDDKIEELYNNTTLSEFAYRYIRDLVMSPIINNKVLRIAKIELNRTYPVLTLFTVDSTIRKMVGSGYSADIVTNLTNSLGDYGREYIGDYIGADAYNKIKNKQIEVLGYSTYDGNIIHTPIKINNEFKIMRSNTRASTSTMCKVNYDVLKNHREEDNYGEKYGFSFDIISFKDNDNLYMVYYNNLKGYNYSSYDGAIVEMTKQPNDSFNFTEYKALFRNILSLNLGIAIDKNYIKCAPIEFFDHNDRYGYMLEFTLMAKPDGRVENQYPITILASTKDTIGNGREYSFDEFIKQGKFYYEIYNRCLNMIPIKMNATEVTYRKSIRIPVQGSISAPATPNPTPISSNPTPPSTTPALPSSSTSEEYRIMETNTGIGQPPFIMSDKDGNINMWNTVRDDSYKPYGIYKSVKKPGEDNFTLVDKKVEPACFKKMGAEVIGIVGIQYESIHVKVKRKDNGREVVEWYTVLTNGSSDPDEWNKCINITNVIRPDSDCAIYYTSTHYNDKMIDTWIVLRNYMYDKFVIDMYDKNQNKINSELVCYGRSSANYTWVFPKIPYNSAKPNIIWPKCLILFVDEQSGTLSAGIRLSLTPVGSTTIKSAFLLFDYRIEPGTNKLRRVTNMNIYNNITKTNDLTFGWGLTPDTQPLIMLSTSFDSNIKMFNIAEMTVSGVNSSPVQSSTYISMYRTGCDESKYGVDWTRYPWGNATSKKGVYNLYAYTKSVDKPPVIGDKILSLDYNILDLRVYGKYNMAKVDHSMGSNFKGKYLLINPSKMTLRPVRRVLFSLGSIKCITDKLIDKKWKDTETKFGFDINTNAKSWSTNGYEGIFHMINFDSNGKLVKELNTGTVKYSKINNDFALPVPNKCKKVKSADMNLNSVLFAYVKKTDNLTGAVVGIGPDGTGYMLRTRKYNNLYAYDIISYDNDGGVISTKCIDIQNLTLHDSSSSTYHPDKTSVGKSNESDTSNIYYNFKLEPMLPNLVIDGTDIYLFVNIINTSLNSTDIRASGEPYFIKLSLIRNGLYYEPKQLRMLSKYLSGFYYEPKAGNQIKQFGYNERYGWFIVIKEPFGDYSGGNTAFIIISSKDTLEKGRSLSANEFWNGMDGYAEIYMNEPTHVYVDDVINSIEDASTPSPVLPPAPKIEELSFTIKPIPVFLGGYYTDFAGASGKLIDNAMNYIYLYRDKVKWREVKVEVTKTPHWTPPMKNNKPYSDPLKFDKVLVATILIKNKNIVNKTLYPVGDNYLYLNFNIKH